MSKTFQWLTALVAVVGLVIGIQAINKTPTERVSPPPPLGTVRQFDVFTEGAGIGDQATRWISKTIGVGSNSVSWTNNTSKTIYADYGQMGFPSGTASSSYTFWLFATSTNSIATHNYDVFTTGNSGTASTTFLIRGFVVATSTMATKYASSTVDSTMEAARLAKTPPTDNQGGLGGHLVIPAGWTVFGVVLNGSGASFAPLATCNGASCETATSTNRGFQTVNVRFRLLFDIP